MIKHKIVRSTQPSISIEEITPQRARELLETNTENFRRPEAKRVSAYSQMMADGAWHLTGDTIKITNGKLIDGQHRLLAVVKSGATIQTAVAWDVAESAQYVDRGKPRTVQQWLYHQGHKDANVVAAVSRLALIHDRGFWKSPQISGPDLAPDSDIIDYANEYKNEIQSAIRVGRPTAKVMPASVACAMAHISASRDPIEDAINGDLIKWFWHGVATGEGVDDGDPPLVLRNRMIAERLSKNKKTPSYYLRWLATIAWNKAVQGVPIHHSALRIRTTGPRKVEPPELVMKSEDAE